MSVFFLSYALLIIRMISFEANSCNQIWGLPVKCNGFKPYLLVAEGI